MEDALNKAKILLEAMPYIKKYHSQKVVIKCGGNVIFDDKLMDSISTDISLMKYVGLNPIIVHGGGPEISVFMKKLGMKVEFVDGLRVTDEETMEIVKMVLVGKINKRLVSRLNLHGKLAVGLSGDDGNLIMAKKKMVKKDLGYVGEVTSIDVEIMEDLIADNFIPVIASLGVGKKGESFNINADNVAGEIAKAVKANKIIFLTNIEGIYENFEKMENLISVLNIPDCQKILDSGRISSGMIPKLEACLLALQGGVERAHILDGRIPHALLLEIFTDEGIGTMIKKNG